MVEETRSIKARRVELRVCGLVTAKMAKTELIENDG
jgi:hypothetical protein